MKPRHENITGIAILVLTFMPLALAQTGSAPRSVDWKGMIPGIREVLKTESTSNPEFGGIEEHYSIGIFKTADITGDGVPEALVYLGTGGASTDEMTVMSTEDHKPVLAVFRGRNGKVSPGVFLQGASVTHTDTVELLPQQHAVHAIHYNYSGNGKLHQCGGEAYTWNAQSKTFDYNPPLTKTLTKATCRQVPKAAR
jgi:hypothetical protein